MDQQGAQPTPQVQERKVGPVYLLSPPVPTQYSVELTFSFQLHPVGRYPPHFDFLFSDWSVHELPGVNFHLSSSLKIKNYTLFWYNCGVCVAQAY